MNKYFSLIILGILSIILFFGCEDDDSSENGNDEINVINVTTSNVNQSYFYYDLVNELEIDSLSNWHLALETTGSYNMSSILFGSVFVAEYSNILFDDMKESPLTFTEDYVQDNRVFEYEGSNEILSYDISVHKVSVTNPDRVYVIYEPISQAIFKLQFLEYISGILVFSFNQFLNN